jgi:hypothetical protein
VIIGTLSSFPMSFSDCPELADRLHGDLGIRANRTAYEPARNRMPPFARLSAFDRRAVILRLVANVAEVPFSDIHEEHQAGANGLLRLGAFCFDCCSWRFPPPVTL